MMTIISALFGCSSNGPATDKVGPKIVDHTQASRMIASENPPLILDVRTPEEYTEGHIPGARLIPLNTISDSLAILSQYKDEEIIAVCRSGRRSGIATEQLTKEGFGKVYNLKGGMVQWKQNGGKIE